MQPATWPEQRQDPAWLPKVEAACIALAIHGAAIGLLLAAWHPVPPAPQHPVRTMRTELVRLASPAPASAPVPPAPPAQAPARAKTAPVPKPEIKRPVAKPILRSEVPIARPANDPPPSSPAESPTAAAPTEHAATSEAHPAAQTNHAAPARATDLPAHSASQAYLPIQKTAPDYPARALRRGIEGDCTVSYTVTTEGRVANPQIVGECHPLFVQASLQAAGEFRYRPRIVGGSAVEVPNVHNTFHYRIEAR